MLDVTNIATLKTVLHASYQYAMVYGYYAQGDGGGGIYYYDAADTTSTDNGGTIIVASDGGRWKLQQKTVGNLYVDQFGAKGDCANGSTGTDDTSAFQKALNAAAPDGTVWFNGLKRYLINSSFTIPQGVRLAATSAMAGTDGQYNTGWYNSRGGILFLNSAATITCYAGASIERGYIFRKGLTIPAANNSTFAGTAITIPDMPGPIGSTDVHINGVMVVGFDRAINCTGNTARLVVTDFLFDCNNGIRVTQAGDPLKFTRCHGYPFATVAYSPYTSAQLCRPGIAYEFTTNADGGIVTDCFAFDYKITFRIDNCGLALHKCNADSPDTYAAYGSSTAYDLIGAFSNVTISQCNAAATGIGFNVNGSTQNEFLSLNQCFIVACKQYGVYNLKGTVLVGSGTRVTGVPEGIMIDGVLTTTKVSDTFFSGITNFAVNNFAGATNVLISDTNYYESSVGHTYNGGELIFSIAAAGSVALPPNSPDIRITGNTNIFGFTNGWPGRVVNIRFSGTPTVTNNATSLRLLNGANFVATANDVLTLRATADGLWEEVSRSTN